MLRALCGCAVYFSLLLWTSFAENSYGYCNCDSDGFWSTVNILQWQKVCDFLIATAYFSIPLELLYFATCSNLFPFKWIVLQFSAFIVLCGLTHLLTMFTYDPHSFLMVLGLTVAKFLTALVSFATSITLLTLIPQLLRVKVRENLLRMKACELNREVDLMKRQEEASWHVRMLTHEIRKSLDRHTILHTTMVELSKTLGLQHCAVWMPDDARNVMVLTHQLRETVCNLENCTIPFENSDVMEIKEIEGVKILLPDSTLGLSSCGDTTEPGAMSAIRMPLLKVSNFKGGTPEIMHTKYAILVLVLPRDKPRAWSQHELEIVEIVADQVAVALSHAAVLEESQLMQDKLAEQYRVLLHAKHEAMMANKSRSYFQRIMSQEMRTLMHSVLGLSSLLQHEKFTPEQRLLVCALTKTGCVLSTFIDDVMGVSSVNYEQLSLVTRPFEMHSMIKEAITVVKCLCACRGDITFMFWVDNTLPDHFSGDEMRAFQVILQLVSCILKRLNHGFLTLSISSYDGTEQMQINKDRVPWMSNFCDGYASVKFSISFESLETRLTPSSSSAVTDILTSDGLEMGVSFSMCRKLVEMMKGNILAASTSGGLSDGITVVLQFQLSTYPPLFGFSPHLQQLSSPNFKGLRTLLVDNNNVNRIVTQKLLEKLGCSVCAATSRVQCLSFFGMCSTQFELIVLDLDLESDKMEVCEIAARIRKFRSGGWPLIVALTVNSEAIVQERCQQAGINVLIGKPLTVSALGEELLRVLPNT